MIPDALMRNMSDEELARAIYCAADMPPIAAELARRLVAAAESALRSATAAPGYFCLYFGEEYD